MVKKRGKTSHKLIFIKHKKHDLIRHKAEKHRKEKSIHGKKYEEDKKHLDLGKVLERNIKKGYVDVRDFFEKEKKYVQEHLKIKKPEKKEEIDRRLAMPFGILYLLSLSLYIFAFLKKSWISVSISLVVMFFCSLASTFSHKTIKLRSLKNEINELREHGKYTTDLDIILILLSKYKKLKVIQLLEGFKISKEVVEGWIDTLEQHKLLNVKFPVFSGMEITLPEAENKEEQNKNGINEESKSIENKKDEA